MINKKFNEMWVILSRRWNLQILKYLEVETAIRFNELKQSVHGISANVLSERLNELEKLGLIKKVISNKSTLHVGYLLDEKCKDLKKIILNLDEWISSYQ